MVAGSEVLLQKIMNSLKDTAMKYGMKKNIKNAKVMRVSKKGGEVNITINGTKQAFYNVTPISMRPLLRSSISDKEVRIFMSRNNK